MQNDLISSLENQEEDLIASIDLEQLFQNPINQFECLTWPHIRILQNYLYPETRNINRNLLVTPYLPKDSVSRHEHTYFEMIYVLSGSCAHHVENSYSILNEGDFIILPPGLHHYILQAENAHLTLFMIHPETLKTLFPSLTTGHDTLSSFLHDIMCRDTLNYYLTIHTDNHPQIQQTLLELKEEMFRSDEYTDHVALTTFSSFMLNVIRNSSHAEFSSSETIVNQDQQILSMIYEQYATITLSQLAESLHYSIPYCSKYLKKNLGCTFSELIQKVRFQQARNLLMNSTLPVNQIGKNIGYETPENFFRAFKKVHGVTPSQYRKNVGKQSEAE
ncbi:MAG: AraC family transcriptional regulator [Clostridiales bacterium]|nr:AraC family transcriptional regulator [Candidatus Blautia equi]